MHVWREGTGCHSNSIVPWTQKEDLEKRKGPQINLHASITKIHARLLSGDLWPKELSVTPAIPERINFSATICIGLQDSSWTLGCGKIQMETHFVVAKTVLFHMTDFGGGQTPKCDNGGFFERYCHESGR